MIRVHVLRELQSQTQEELDALLPSHKGMISALRPSGGRSKVNYKERNNYGWQIYSA
jgi:hypothetical protein